MTRHLLASLRSSLSLRFTFAKLKDAASCGPNSAQKLVLMLRQKHLASSSACLSVGVASVVCSFSPVHVYVRHVDDVCVFMAAATVDIPAERIHTGRILAVGDDKEAYDGVVYCTCCVQILMEPDRLSRHLPVR